MHEFERGRPWEEGDDSREMMFPRRRFTIARVFFCFSKFISPEFAPAFPILSLAFSAGIHRLLRASAWSVNIRIYCEGSEVSIFFPSGFYSMNA